MINTSSIREHMEVVGSDGKHLGKVDHVRGDRIELTRSMGVGAHHSLPLSLIDVIDDKVRLSVTEDQAKDHWQEVKH